MDDSHILIHQKSAEVINMMLGSVVTMLPFVTFGTLSAYLTIGLPQLLEPNGTGIIIDLHQISWILSINQPARVIGLFISGYLSEKMGRKRCLILGSIVQIISAISVYFCTSYESLMMTVALTGLSVCMVTIPSYALLSEICLIRYRSSLASINTLHGNIGWLIGLCLGLVVPVDFYTITLSFPSVIFLMVCWRMPESPVWLMRSGRDVEARQMLQWLRGQGYNIEPEMKELEVIVAGDRNDVNKSLTSTVMDRTFLIPLALTCALFCFQATCGCDVIAYYNGIIFNDVGIRPELAAILYQLTITSGYLVSPLLLSRVDCRYINIIFLLITGMTMFCMGLSFMFPSSLGSRVSLPCLIISGALYGLGVGPVTFIMSATLFTQKKKSTGVAMGQTTRALVVLFQMKAFPSLLGVFGISGVFFLASCMSILGCLFSFFFLPETKNKSVYELETMFVGKTQPDSELGKNDIEDKQKL